VKIQDCRVDGAVRQQLERGPGLGRGLDGMATTLQHIADALKGAGVIVDDEDARRLVRGQHQI
jgi:hypothetical protein